MNEIDQIMLNFSPTSLFILNIILGFVMFGVALDLTLDDFKIIARLPRAVLVGLIGQFLLLPAVTFVLVQFMQPLPSIALGMILVASCPGGNISNFFVYLGKGNAALSIAMTAFSTAAAIIMTPLNFGFWGGMYAPAAELLTQVSVSPADMAVTIFLLLGLPLALGMFLNHRFPQWAEKARRPMKIFSMVFFIVFVLVTLAANWTYFLTYIGVVMFTVLIHNALALTIGYFGGMAVGLSEYDRRATGLEVGIQNSGLGLILIFNFFGGLGGMAIIAAWWGVWHIISGYTLALLWSRREAKGTPAVAASS